MAVNPVSRDASTSPTPRRATRSASRARASFGGTHRARPPARGAHHRARRRDASLPRHLNKHIDYDVVPAPGRRRRRRASPPRSAWRSTGDGATLYVAAFGSSKVGVFDTAALEADTFVPERGRPHRGERRRPERPRARRGARAGSTCCTRFDNAVSVDRHDDARRRSRTCRLHNPEPPSVVERPAVPLRRASHARATARRRARAATSSATSTAWPGTSATPTTSVLNNPNPFRVTDVARHGVPRSSTR